MEDFSHFTTPVVLCVFNRPETTQEVFEVVAKVRPKKLYILADGPRKNNANDVVKCQEVRAIFDQINWDCDLTKIYAEENVGIRNNIPNGLNQVFKREEQAIILEDDIIPDLSFFNYCEELLDRYKNDDRIAMISGYNDQLGISRTECSYFFSRHTHIWGWATWRRAWKFYDVDAKIWKNINQNKYLDSVTIDKDERKHWQRSIGNVLSNKHPGWDAQWTVAVWSQNMLAILPNKNLIKNIGFGQDATHNHTSNTMNSFTESSAMQFPMQHPEIILPNTEADKFSARIFFTSSIPRKILRKIFGRNLNLIMNFYQKIPF